MADWKTHLFIFIRANVRMIYEIGEHWKVTIIFIIGVNNCFFLLRPHLMAKLLSLITQQWHLCEKLHVAPLVHELVIFVSVGMWPFSVLKVAVCESRSLC